MTVRILEGDVRERLAELPAGSIQCCVTSPPYFGLRDYGTAQWDGGDPACDHGPRKMGNANKGNVREVLDGDRMRCHSCGATRIDRQIGLESTLAEYVASLVDVFRQVRRVLRDDGTLWLNLGDSYAGGNTVGRNDTTPDAPTRRAERYGTGQGAGSFVGVQGTHQRQSGIKPKDMMMVPARLALALQDDGWYLRSDIIWHKPNPMPESVTDRPTSSHEHIFLLTKRARYFYDADAVREEADPASLARINQSTFATQTGGSKDYRNGINPSRSMRQTLENFAANPGRNMRNVWTIATQPYKEAHFATFPTEIPRRCIRAGTSERGQCPQCGAPWVRCVERTPMEIRSGPRAGMYGSNTTDGLTGTMSAPATSTTTGWQSSCTCDAGDPVPQTVLDPFAGAGTTLLVADQLGRDAVGIELNPEYARLIERRLTDAAPMFAEVETVPTINQAPLFAEVL